MSAPRSIAIAAPRLRQAEQERRRQSRWSTVNRSRRPLVGATLVVVVVLLALLAPVIGRHDPNFGDFAQVLAPPSFDHPFGTDGFGRDVLARVLVA